MPTYFVGTHAPLLPLQKQPTGRPSKDHRTIINGMLWLDKSGVPWRDLPERYGPWQTVATRFYRWTKQGVWDKILAEVQKDADANGQVQWSIHYVDSSNMRAHRHAAGTKKGDPQTEASGRSRGGFSTKIHVRCKGKGKTLVFELTPGEQHESTVFELLMEGGAIKRRGRGRPRRLPARIAADKGYSNSRIRGYLAS